MPKAARNLKVLIIGATSAIAIATARRMAESGQVFYLLARNRERLEAVASDLRLRGASKVFSAAVELTHTAGHSELLSKAAEALGAIDLALIAYGTLGDQKKAEEDYLAASEI